jgi:hypothetical protein
VKPRAMPDSPTSKARLFKIAASLYPRHGGFYRIDVRKGKPIAEETRVIRRRVELIVEQARGQVV